MRSPPVAAAAQAATYRAELPARLCARFGEWARAWEAAHCSLKCAQSGELFSEKCVCAVSVEGNMTHVTDAFMAGAFLRQLLWQGRALWDEHALLRATRLARDRQLDLDARRAEHPTRQRGLSGRWVQGGAAPAPQRVDDAYNLYVDYKRSDAAREAHQHGERAPVPEFDTLYRAALAVRLAGLLLADPLLSPAPLACPALFDPAAAPAFDPAEGPPMTLRLLYPHRDPYWPTYGHPADEF